MELRTEESGEVLTLSPRGRIDHTNCDQFLAAIQPHVDRCGGAGVQLVFDLSELEYISSAGLRCFLMAAKQVKPRGGTVAVAAMNPIVHEIFEISRFHLVFPIFATVSEALEQLSRQAPTQGRS
ncbi:MAG: anti-sigma factor antagonist [Proteobacteria bacterium]|nr:MAG: anti-sigma factor antagonist [Pseudomonadota bacterium]